MKWDMFKKTISIILTLVLIFSVTSCSTFTKKSPTEEINTPETSETDNESDELKGVVVDGELRLYNGELVDNAKHLIENGLIASEIHVFYEFSVDLNDTVAENGGIVYSKVLNNIFGINSLKDIKEFIASVYSNEDTIYKISYRNGKPLFIEHDGQLYASSDGSSGTVGYSIVDWNSVYLTNVTETTAVVNYPLFYYRSDIKDAAVMHRNTIVNIDGIWLLDNILDEESIESDERTSMELGIRSIFLNHLRRFNMYDFVKYEGETIDMDGSKYTNIGYIISPGDPFTSSTYSSMEVYIKHANDKTLEIINDHFTEIDGKLYVKNIEELREEYKRDYKCETLEVLSANDEEANLKINYLDLNNNEKGLNFKMYSDPERSWIWNSDTIF